MIIRRLINYAQEKVRTAERREALNRLAVWFLPPVLPLSAQGRTYLATLRDAGNAYLPPVADAEALRTLRESLASRPCYDPWHPALTDFTVAETPPGTNNARIRGVRDIPQARAIANCPQVLEVVSHYLGCKPTIDDVTAWWSLAGRPAPKEEQFFHRDNDAIRFVKLFVYLGDVAADDGAHFFVAGSHRDNHLLEPRRRYTDEEVAAAFEPARIKCMQGPFGSAFLEDTFGLHKGTVPTRHSRLLFQVRYSSYPSVFARTTRVLQADGAYDPYINRLIA